MNRILLFAIPALCIVLGISAIIGSVAASIIELDRYMREREEEGRAWIDPAEREAEGIDKKRGGGKV